MDEWMRGWVDGWMDVVVKLNKILMSKKIVENTAVECIASSENDMTHEHLFT